MRLLSAASEWPLIYLKRRSFVPPPLPRIDGRQAEFVLQEIDVACVYQHSGRLDSTLKLVVKQQNETEDFMQGRVLANVLRRLPMKARTATLLLPDRQPQHTEPPGLKLVSPVGPKVKLV